MSLQIRLAASQFPVTGEITHNHKYIRSHIQKAAESGANVVLFPETALPGYGPKHLGAQDSYNWTRLREYEQDIVNAAHVNKVWVVLGSMRQMDGGAPLICLHVISKTGDIVGTYDKRKLYGKEREFYGTGNKPLVLDIEGHRCGFLICYDNIYPSLYEEYRAAGVGLLLHAFFNAENTEETSITPLMEANLIARAADFQMCIVASNSSARYCPMPATIAQPDGTTVRAKRHVASLVFDTYPPTN